MNFKSLLIKASTFVLAATCFINSANAGIITQDDVVAGNLQGLEWLTWDETEGQSFNSIVNDDFKGLNSAGWRHATTDEFTELLTSLGVTKGGSGNNNIFQLRDMLFPGFSSGIVTLLEECGDGACDAFFGFENSNWAYIHFPIGQYGVSPKDRESPVVNVLVRSTEVPEPSTLAIFALGLLGLSARKLKKS